MKRGTEHSLEPFQRFLPAEMQNGSAGLFCRQVSPASRRWAGDAWIGRKRQTMLAESYPTDRDEISQESRQCGECPKNDGKRRTEEESSKGYGEKDRQHAKPSKYDLTKKNKKMEQMMSGLSRTNEEADQ